MSSTVDIKMQGKPFKVFLKEYRSGLYVALYKNEKVFHQAMSSLTEAEFINELENDDDIEVLNVS